jgi:bisphosphoglycerate-dependent phosphoglycerate mutase
MPRPRNPLTRGQLVKEIASSVRYIENDGSEYYQTRVKDLMKNHPYILVYSTAESLRVLHKKLEKLCYDVTAEKILPAKENKMCMFEEGFFKTNSRVYVR